MGYSTDFIGEWTITPPLREIHRLYLTQFAEIRHMRRDGTKLGPDPIREAVDLPVGVEGEFYVGTVDKYNSQGGFGASGDPSIVNSNSPASTQPGLWCQWVPHSDGSALAWDDGEKFYEYIGWLKYLVDMFFTPWGYSLRGIVRWQGEGSDDFGEIQVTTGNKILVAEGTRAYGKPKEI